MIWRYPHDLGDLQMDTPILYKWVYNGSIRVFEWNMNGIWMEYGLWWDLNVQNVFTIWQFQHRYGITTYAWNIKILMEFNETLMDIPITSILMEYRWNTNINGILMTYSCDISGYADEMDAPILYTWLCLKMYPKIWWKLSFSPHENRHTQMGL